MIDPRAIDALRNHQRQLDADGVEVGVSRQAVDELLLAYDALAEAAGKVTDARCEFAAGCGCTHCRAVADLRALLGEKP